MKRRKRKRKPKQDSKPTEQVMIRGETEAACESRRDAG